jgi:hypothetical protein
MYICTLISRPTVRKAEISSREKTTQEAKASSRKATGNRLDRSDDHPEREPTWVGVMVGGRHRKSYQSRGKLDACRKTLQTDPRRPGPGAYTTGRRFRSLCLWRVDDTDHPGSRVR